MIGDNYFYREPFNSSIDADYEYIYQFKDITTYKPDEIVFLILALLIINTIATIPISLFILRTVIKEPELHKNKFVFISMICASDLVNALTSNIVVLSAIGNGLILKTACSTVGMLHASTILVRVWAITSIGFLAVIVTKTAHRDDTERIQSVYTQADVGAAVVMTLFYAIVGRSGLVGEFFVWDNAKFTCGHKIEQILGAIIEHDTFTGVYVMIIVLFRLTVIILPIPLAIYFTYRKCSFYGCRKFRIGPEVSLSDIDSSTRVTSIVSPAGQRSKSRSSSTEQIFYREEKEEVDTVVTLYLQCALWLPYLITWISDNSPIEPVVYHSIQVLDLLTPCVFITFNSALKKRLLHVVRQLGCMIKPSEDSQSSDEARDVSRTESRSRPASNSAQLAMMKDMTRMASLKSRRSARLKRLAKGAVGITNRSQGRNRRGNNEMVEMDDRG